MTTVFVLGAGASKAIRFNAPLMSDLVIKIIELALRETTDLAHVGQNGEGLAQILHFVAHLYTHHAQVDEPLNEYWENLSMSRTQVEQLVKSKDLGTLPSLEDILTQIDLAIAQSRPISSYWPVHKLRELRQHFIYAIARVIKDMTIPNLAKDLDEDLLELFRGALNGSNVISLNYDLIVDNLLVDFEDFCDYGIKIRGIYDRAGNGHRYEHYHSFRDTNTLLLKLHGSLNWLYCPKCRELDVTQKEKGTISFIYERANGSQHLCPVCSVPYEPLIITPTFLKDYDNSSVQRLWDYAEIVLERATEIVFVGYSLPDADIILRSVLSRALAINRMNALEKSSESNSPLKFCKIRLVDCVNVSDAESIKRGNETRQRYERLFGKIHDVDYFPGGLKEFIEKTMPY